MHLREYWTPGTISFHAYRVGLGTHDLDIRANKLDGPVV